MNRDSLYNIKSVILGHNVGDALGVPVEFESREARDMRAVVGMEGYGTFPVPAGSWSDDSSMTLCALDVLAEEGFTERTYDKTMGNFIKWLSDAKFTPTGMTFDVGGTCYSAVCNYVKNGCLATESGGTDELSNGNGSLMRILPFALNMYYTAREEFGKKCYSVIRDASALTHAHERSKVSCCIYANVLWHILDNPTIESVHKALKESAEEFLGNKEYDYFRRIFSEGFKDIDRKLIKSTGYVIDTLEASLWCLLTTDNYTDCVLKAVNLGGDTDTIAAIAGGLAGALYGLDTIPEEWLDVLQRRQWIEEMCKKADENWNTK